MITIRRSPTGRRLALVTVIVLLCILIGQLTWNAYMAPRFLVNSIILETDLPIDDAQLLSLLRLEGQTWASLDTDELESSLEAYPVIRRARVVKVFPDTLNLYIYRRRPLVAALAEDAGASVLTAFDEEGYAVSIGGNEETSLPVLSGPTFPIPVIGARLPGEFRDVLGQLGRLRNNEPVLFDLVSEIEILPRSTDGYELRLYMNHIPIPVLLGRDLDGETLRQAVMVLDVLEASEGVLAVEEADIRGGHVVYRRVGEG